MLVILDGWAHGTKPEASAIAHADTPYFDGLFDKYPHSELKTSGQSVGLPDGQMGNSEVGHINIGAGRVVYQELVRINRSIEDGGFFDIDELKRAAELARNENRSVHLMGLVSDGGVHSHIDHLKALIRFFDDGDAFDVYVHAFTDGRDTDPKSGRRYLRELLDFMEQKSAVLASVVGRYYAMDRDKRWERTREAYDLVVHGKGERSNDILKTVEERYEKAETDEFLKPIAMDEYKKSQKLRDGDIVVFFNYRTDRPRQLTEVLSQRAFPDYGMRPLNLHMITMTPYDEKFNNVHVLFDKQKLSGTMGEVISSAHLSQLRIAETEKYPHVTYFFNGGREEPFEGESRILINSPKVATYDLQPEMSAPQVTDALLEKLESDPSDFICLNYANPDMVAHTGVFKAAVIAVETVDEQLSRLLPQAIELGYEILIISDHGNADYMVNEDGTPNTAHTKNPVPCIYIGSRSPDLNLKDGILADVAPTLLDLMGLTAPKEMEGSSLLVKKEAK